MVPKEYTLYKPGPINQEELGHALTSGKTLHPTVAEFFLMPITTRAEIYSARHPETDYNRLIEALSSKAKHLKWSGSDLLNVKTPEGRRMKYVLETNSCPSGALDLPTKAGDIIGESSYERVLRNTLLPQIEGEGDLAVIWDKNRRGTRIYARTLAALTGRDVHYLPLIDSEEFRLEEQEDFKINGREIAGAFRYVTQKPWERLAINLKIPIVNPIIGCVAGGRNKLLAAKAYKEFNAENPNTKINYPLTTEEMSRDEALEIISEWGGVGVIKNPYSNAGQGVYTITGEKDLEDFVRSSEPEGIFIVQQMIGNDKVTTNGRINPLRHVGSSDIEGNPYALDVRMMVVSSERGYLPVSLYGRRAKAPLNSNISDAISSWDVFGTNLSVKLGTDQWKYEEEERQIVVTPEEFPKLNIDLGDLVDVYVQSALSNLAINRMAEKLMQGGKFNERLFAEVNKDPTFNNSILKI